MNKKILDLIKSFFLIHKFGTVKEIYEFGERENVIPIILSNEKKIRVFDHIEKILNSFRNCKVLSKTKCSYDCYFRERSLNA